MIQINQVQKDFLSDKKIPNISGLVKRTDFDAKSIGIKGKIPSISGLITTAALTAIENKIPHVINRVKKTEYDAKILDIESKYVATTDYNKYTSQILNAKIEQMD